MSSKVYFLAGFLIFCGFVAKSQNSVGIGIVNPNKNAVLELVSTGNNQGLLVPKLTTAQRTATSFISSLSASENGLLIFDKDENKFYFWQSNQWQPLKTGLELTAGDGIAIAGNTISAIPQDLQLVGSTLTITNNTSATPINLSAFTGVNTDDQTLSFNGATGLLSLSTLGAPSTVTITGVTPGGTAGGDLSGSFPNPVINTAAITSAKILDGTIATGDLADNSITSLKIVDGVVSSADIQDGSIGTVDLANNSITNAKITPGVNGEVLVTAGGITTWASGAAPSGAAGGDLSGTYPNPTVNPISSAKITDGTISAIDLANDAVTSVKILDGTIGTADLGDNSITSLKIVDGTIATADMANNSVTNSKIVPGANGEVLVTAGGITTWASGAAPSGAAGGDLSGTYPNPTVNPINSAKITDGTIAAIDLANDAVTSVKILDGTIGTADLGDNSITSLKIIDGVVSSSDIQDGSITTVDIANSSVTNSKITPGVNGEVLVTAGGVTTWASGAAPSGVAGGDLSGTYPNPTVNPITSGKITDGTIAAIDLANDAVTSAKILDGSIATIDLANNSVTNSKITPGVNGEVLVTAGGVATWASGAAPSGVAGGDLSGSYPNPTVNPITSGKITDGTIATIDLANDAVTSVKILDGTVVTADIADNSITSLKIADGVVSSADIQDGTISTVDIANSSVTNLKIAPGANGEVLTTSGGVTTWAAPTTSGTAGGDLTGTFPNPTVAIGAVTSTKILDGTIADVDISTTASIAVSKVAPGTNGQVLTTTGGVPQWAILGANTLITNTGTNNLFAGLPIGGGGTDNAFYGTSAGVSNSGNWNVFIGTNAATNTSVGDLNTIIGWRAGFANTGHQGNTFVGAQAGESASPTANISTLIGEKAGQIVQGTGNTMVGERAGLITTTGFFNTFVGTTVAASNVGGARLTLIGHNANVSAPTLVNSTAIGEAAIVSASNNMVFGDNAVVGWGFGVAPGAAAIRVGSGVTNGNGATLTLTGNWTSTSDRTKKHSINEIRYGLAEVLKLRPVDYSWNTTNQRDFGFIAQEVKNVLPEIVYGEEGQMSISYGQITAVLTKAVQEQQKEIEELQSKLLKEQRQVAALEASIQNLKSENSEISSIKKELEEIKKVLGMEASLKNKK